MNKILTFIETFLRRYDKRDYSDYDNGNIPATNPEDYTFGDDWFGLNPKKFSNKSFLGYTYNQRSPSSHSSCCTMYSAITALSNLKDYEFSDEEIEDIVQAAERVGYVRKKGWQTYKGVDIVRKRWNAKFPNDKTVSFRLDFRSNEAEKMLQKGYTIVTSISGDTAYSNDRADNGVINGGKFSIAWRHAIAHYFKDGHRKADSYNGYRPKYNDYGVENPFELLKNGNMYPNAYVFLDEKEFDAPFIEDMHLINMLIKANSALWHQSTNDDLKAILHETNDKLRLLLKKPS